MKGAIPRAGPKYRLGMYFETIHNLPHFDNDMCRDEGGYTSYWETDTEVDSDFGNFIFNNVSGDSASLICIDDAVDIVSIRERQLEAITRSNKSHPHYKLEQSRSSPLSPTEDHSLGCSTDSKRLSNRSRRSHHSGSDESYDQPPPVPPPRRTSPLATGPDEFVDHTYETLDDCQEDYLAHQQEMIYVSKGSDGSGGSRGSAAKPASLEDAGSDHIPGNKAEECCRRSPEQSPGAAATGGVAKPRSNSLHLSKTKDLSSIYRQRRKMSDPSTCRKRRAEKVGSKGSGYPAPMKGFPVGVAEDYTEHLSQQPISGSHSPDQNNTSGSGSPVVGARGTVVASPDHRRKASGGQKSSGNTHSHSHHKKNSAAAAAAQPLVIKHKGKTYFVPVVDQKLEKELEKRSKSNNPTVAIKKHHFSSHAPRANAAHGQQSMLASSGHSHRLPASPPKVEPSDIASPNKRKAPTMPFKSPPHASAKQVTHYGVL